MERMAVYQPSGEIYVIGAAMKNRREWIHAIAYGSFYAAIIIEVMMVILDKSSYTNPLEGRLFQLTFVLFFLKVCLTKYTFREYAAIFLFGVLGAVSYFVTGRNEVIRLVMLIAACKDIDMNKCLKRIFWLTLAGCGVIVLLSVTGIYGSVSLTMDFGRGGVETRYTLGMGHPNALQCMVWALTALGLYLYAEEMKWYHCSILLLFNFGVFLLSDSRTSLLVVIFTMAMSYLTSAKMPEQLKRLAAWLGGISTMGSIAISVLIAANAYRVYNYDWHLYEGQPDSIMMVFVKLNRILTGRIRILTETDGWEGSVQSWRLFSGPETEYYFDMGWVRLFYWYGIIPACIFVLVLFILTIYCYRRRAYSAITLIAAFSLYTVIEAHAISQYLARNYTFFLIGMYWCQMLQKSEWQKDGINEENINC